MRKHLSNRAPQTIHTSAQESMKARAREVLTHVIGRISARDGALALSGASAVVGLGARANAFIAFNNKKLPHEVDYEAATEWLIEVEKAWREEMLITSISMLPEGEQCLDPAFSRT